MRKEASEKEMDLLNPETVFTKIENGTYEVLKTEGNEWQVLDENKNILEDVYVNSGYTNDFEINIDGISYDKMDIEHNNAINKACNLKLSHETLSMLSDLAYYKCADEGSMTEGVPLSTRIENTVKDFAIKYSQNEKLIIDSNLSVCLHTMTIYKDGVSIEMEFWYPLMEELGFA